MKVTIGGKGLKYSWQKKFPKNTKCRCGGTARIGFVAYEGLGDQTGDESPHICGLHPNKGKGNLWVHDVMACAVYLCSDCLSATALINQA